MVGRNQSLNKAHKGIWGLNIVLVQIDEPDDIRKFIRMLVALINVNERTARTLAIDVRSIHHFDCFTVSFSSNKYFQHLMSSLVC